MKVAESQSRMNNADQYGAPCTPITHFLGYTRSSGRARLIHADIKNVRI